MSDEKFRKDLEHDVEFCTKWARRNYWWAHVVFGVSVLASFLSTVLVAGNLAKDIFRAPWDRVIASVVAALPAVMLLVNNTLRFEERTKWFWRKTRTAERFLRRVEGQRNPEGTTLSDEYSRICEELEGEWPAFGSSPSQPKSS